MADLPDCPLPLDLIEGDGIDIDQTGSGTPSDPTQYTISTQLSNDSGNAATFGLDGGIFVDECDLGPCVDGLKNVPTNQAIPIDSNDFACLGIQYDDGSPVPFDPATGVWELQNINAIAQTYDASCDQRVFRNRFTGELFVPDGQPFRATQGTIGGANSDTVVYDSNQTYLQSVGTITNFDDCNRLAQITAHYEWAGFTVFMENGDRISMNHQIIPPTLGATWETATTSFHQTSFNSPTDSLVARLGQFSCTRIGTLAAGASMTLGVRYQTGALIFGNPTGYNPSPGIGGPNVFDARVTWTMDW